MYEYDLLPLNCAYLHDGTLIYDERHPSVTVRYRLMRYDLSVIVSIRAAGINITKFKLISHRRAAVARRFTMYYERVAIIIYNPALNDPISV